MQPSEFTQLSISNQEAEALARQHYGIEGRARRLPGEIDFNFRLDTAGGPSYTLKLSRPGADRRLLEMQAAVLKRLEAAALSLRLPLPLADQNGQLTTTIQDEQGRQRFLRLMAWVPGKVFAKASPHSPALLESLGRACGQLCRALDGFRHPAAKRYFKWDPGQLPWVREQEHLFEGRQAALFGHFLGLFEREAQPRLPRLRKSVNYNDANDYNVLVSEKREGHPATWSYEVTGFIDFGDTLYTQTVNELAIALAYALMDKPDPLAAAVPAIRGFHAIFPLQEEEVAALFALIGARLLISATNSALNKQKEPDNEYLLISERPAWALLDKLSNIPPALAHYTFRYACGWEPCPPAPAFREWARRQDFAPLTALNLAPGQWRAMDLGVGSPELGNNHNFHEQGRFLRHIERLMEDDGVPAGAGGYGEVRPFYTTDAYLQMGNDGPHWRSVHLGIDIWGAAGTAVFAPFEGKVHSFADNAHERDYGPTIILEHEPEDGPRFFTLYGHLNRQCLKGLTAGMPVRRGQPIAAFGQVEENGAWPPHLHFQVMLDTLGNEGDFPGVGFPEQWPAWKSICPNPEPLAGLPEGASRPAREELSPEAVLSKRHSLLGRSLSVSYHRPLHVVRGYMQYLYDAGGRRYLDTVNNVPHVGHQHPLVVRAAKQQMELLNTNTRYLHTHIVRFAEELLAKLPPELSVVHFVNSGSEANELALRLARAYTSQRDMVVVEAGYHGNTNACVDISSYKFDGKGGQGAPDWVHATPIPDPYRGLYPGAGSGPAYANHVQMAIEKVQQQGRGIAGFIAESILSCGGQVVPPPGYLREAYRYVREAGGACIADEVQVGFGRVGEAFWGFELQGAVPDIVVMGKPIGNGHPLGAVACRPAIAEAFANGMEYFNTFGGNPVSCAVGREVLRIIEAEGLQEHARQTGNYLLEGLRGLQQQYPLIGDVRGHGLFLGFELVANRESREPATAQAGYLANRMREKGVLMSADGPYNNVLKIKPPMCFNQSNADFLLQMLEEALREDFCRNGPACSG
ncbi:MAG: aminotransferase class III-fold pyridoxal phosphate-dependent enzyme [Lewinellaceae bacterium]|nr:aminotransferase class III-fold pyridoxal phosphate-dependent enzyme [Phaeodactylibacter sp.]MCB9036776.1 aminotransferase class III-fold pyridoxal phosphate-dependent enzyme [Lewinellaceae bacterium]